ncbi:MAG: STAS domain-containing protein [Oscillospiraceae bacterium]|nr:STAS domain-containing protein [Oscillospiraceae bacterium]
MTINKIQKDGKTTFALSGRMDAAAAPELQEVLIAELENAKYVDLDFAGIAYISSAGLRTLLLGEKTAKGKGVQQTLVNVSEDIMEVFKMTGFSGILHFGRGIEGKEVMS